MKAKRNLLSVLLVSVLLVATVCGVLVFGANAEATNEVYVVDGTGGGTDAEGNPTFATIEAALEAARAEASQWEAGSSLTIKLAVDVSYTGDGSDIIFGGVKTIFIADHTKLPIILVSAKAEGTAAISFASAKDTQKWFCTNDYTFRGLQMKFSKRDKYAQFFAGSGNVVLDQVTLTGVDADTTCNAAFAADTGNVMGCFSGWTKENVDAQIARFASESGDRIRTSMTFLNMEYAPVQGGNWTLQRLVGRISQSNASTDLSDETVVSNSMTEARIIIDGENSNVGMICGTQIVNAAANWPGKTVIEVKDGTVGGIVGDSGATSYNTNNGKVKNILLDIIVSGGTIDVPRYTNKGVDQAYEYSISGGTRGDPYGASTEINIYVKNDAELVGNVNAFSGGGMSDTKAMAISGKINIYLEGGTVPNVYGCRNDTPAHSVAAGGEINIIYKGTTVTGTICGWANKGAISGSVCIDIQADLVGGKKVFGMYGSGSVENGGKAGIKLNTDISATGNVCSMVNGTVKTGGEVYYNLESGTVTGRLYTVSTATKTWTAESGALIATRMNGGTYKVDNCVLYGADYTTIGGLNKDAIFRMEWNGTIPLDPTSSYYFSPILNATIPCKVEAIFTDFNNVRADSASQHGRWIRGTTVLKNGVTLIMDTTEDGWNGGGENDSNATKIISGADSENVIYAAITSPLFQEWGSTVKIQGESKSYINGGDKKTIQIGDFELLAGNSVTVVAKNFIATGEFGVSRSNGNGSQADGATGTYAIGDVSFNVEDAKCAGIFTTNSSYAGTGAEGDGTFGTSSKVYGTLSVSIKNVENTGRTVLSTPYCYGAVEAIEIKDSILTGDVYLYKGDLTLDGVTTSYQYEGDKDYSNGSIYLADGTSLHIKDTCDKFREGIGLVPQSDYATVGGDITIDGGINYGYSSSGAGGITGNNIVINNGVFERKISGESITIKGGQYGVNSTSVVVTGGNVSISGEPKFNWGFQCTGDVVSLDGGTITMTGAGVGHIQATQATANTTIVKATNSMVHDHVILTIPQTYAPYVILGEDSCRGFLTKEVDGNNIEVTENCVSIFHAYIDVTNRTIIKLVPDQAQVDRALDNNKALSFTYTNKELGIEEEGTITLKNWNPDKNRYEIILPAVAASDFDKTIKFTGAGALRDVNVSVDAVVALALESTEFSTEEKAIFEALGNYGKAAAGTLDPAALEAAAIKGDDSDIDTTGLTAVPGAGSIKFIRKTLLMGDTIGIRLITDEATKANLANAKVYLGDVELVDAGLCVVNADEGTVDLYINARRLNTVLTFVVEDGNNTTCLTLTDTVKHIAAQLVDANSANLKAQATYNLIQAVQTLIAAEQA